MRWLPRFSINNIVMVHMLLIGLVLMGTYAYTQLPRQLMSELAFNWVFVRIDYPGVPPDDIEELIAIPIEDAIRNVDGVSSISNRSKEGFAFFSIKFEQLSDEEFDTAYQELKDAAAVVDLPDDAIDPLWINFSSAEMVPMLSLVVSGTLEKGELFDLALSLEEDIEAIPGISKADKGGIQERQIWVEVDPDRLNAVGMPLDSVVMALRAANVSIPGGLLTVGSSDYLLRTTNQFESVSQIEAAVIGASPTGGSVTVGDVAHVEDLWEDAKVIARFEGEPAVTLTVVKKPLGNSLDLTGQIRAMADEYNARYPNKEARVTVTGDSSKQIASMLGDLQKNALFGMLLVVTVLWAVLGLRNALLTALGIPLAFLATFIFMWWAGASLDGNSLFGLVLVLGIIVDDAIVLVENAARHRALGKSRVEAIVDGVSEVSVPVIAAILTTVAAFLPLMLMPGLMGKFMRIIPVVVSMALAASLIEALISLPAHIHEWGEQDTSKLEARERMFDRFVGPYIRALRVLTALRVPRLAEVEGWRSWLVRIAGWMMGGLPAIVLGVVGGGAAAFAAAGGMEPGGAAAAMPDAVKGALIGLGIALSVLILPSLIARRDLPGNYGLQIANLAGLAFTISLFFALIPTMLGVVFGGVGALLGLAVPLLAVAWFFLTSLRKGSLSGAVRGLFERARSLRFTIFAAVYLAMVPAALGVVSQVDLDLFSGEEIPQFFVHVRLPEGTALSQTDQIVAELDRLTRETLPPEHVVSVTSHAGFLMSETEWFFKANYGQLDIQLSEPKSRDLTLNDLMALLRPVIERVPGPDSIELVPINNGPPTGADVELKLQGPSLERLDELAVVLRDEMGAVEGVEDVRDNFVHGKKELRVRVDPERAALYGVRESQVGLALRAAYEGAEATRFQDDGDDVPVLVRYPREARGDLTWLDRTMVPTASGGLIPFREVAEIDVGRSIDAIRRYQGERTITLTANVDKTKNTAIDAVNEVKRRLADFSERFPGYRIDYTGEFQEFQKSLDALSYLSVVGLILVYMILGIQFGSFLQPVIIIGFTFPGALFGSAVALLVTGTPLSILTLYGLVALLGIVVNDSLVFISFINSERKRGKQVRQAILEAGRLRLRPIVLTTVTTIFGLLPMAIGLGGKSDVWAPLAATIAFGLLFATATTLLVIPPVYRVFADLTELASQALGRVPEDEPAP